MNSFFIPPDLTDPAERQLAEHAAMHVVRSCRDSRIVFNVMVLLAEFLKQHPEATGITAARIYWVKNPGQN